MPRYSKRPTATWSRTTAALLKPRRPGARRRRPVGVLAWLVAAAAFAAPAAAREPGTPPPRTTRPDPGAEAFRIRIVNRLYGAISVRRPGDAGWRRVGRVLRPCPGRLHAIGDKEFTAADWAPVAGVAASAVNAIHIKVDQPAPHARVFSVLPAELATQGPTGSYRDARASILTDVPAGTAIFGPAWAPLVGDALLLAPAPGRAATAWPAGRAPALGDQIVIRVRAAPAPAAVEIENHWGGLVEAVEAGRRRVIGRVYRPLGGTGRFGGTVYQTPGRVRANHPGVLCVSTSPRGTTGGFQIVPAGHANAPTLAYVQATTAYLVVGPHSLETPPLEGRGPLFGGGFVPGDRVEAFVDGRWGPPPEVAGKKASALGVVEKLRLIRGRRARAGS